MYRGGQRDAAQTPSLASQTLHLMAGELTLDGATRSVGVLIATVSTLARIELRTFSR